VPDQRTVALVAVLVVFGTVAPVGTVAARAGDSDARGDSTAPTRISSCTAITESGEYVLASDVENGSPTNPQTGLGACIAVRTDDVTLRGNGHTVAAKSGGEPGVVGVLVGGGSANAEVARPANVTVTNLTTTRWGGGVAVVGATDATLRNVSAVNNLGDGLFVENASGARLLGGTVRGSNTGVFVRRAPDADLSGLTVAENLAGVSVRRSDDATVSAVSVTGNGQFGVAVFASANATVENSAISENGFADVALSRSDDARLRNLTIAPESPSTPGEVSSVGVYLNDSAAIALTDVSVADAPGWAVYATGGSTAVGERVRLENTEVSFEGRDVALDSATDAPPLPTERQVVGDPLFVAPTAGDADLSQLSLSVGYDAAAVGRATATEETLSIWRFDAGDDWQRIETTVDAERNRASATVGDLSRNGTVIALAGEGRGESVNETDAE
jgi:hypothetical protein